MLRYKSCD